MSPSECLITFPPVNTTWRDLRPDRVSRVTRGIFAFRRCYHRHISRAGRAISLSKGVKFLLKLVAGWCVPSVFGISIAAVSKGTFDTFTGVDIITGRGKIYDFGLNFVVGWSASIIFTCFRLMFLLNLISEGMFFQFGLHILPSEFRPNTKISLKAVQRRTYCLRKINVKVGFACTLKTFGLSVMSEWRQIDDETSNSRENKRLT